MSIKQLKRAQRNTNASRRLAKSRNRLRVIQLKKALELAQSEREI
jgi:hypothetical protein